MSDWVEELKQHKTRAAVASAIALILRGAEHATDIPQILIEDDRGGTGTWVVRFQSHEGIRLDDAIYRVAQGTMEAEKE